MWLTVNRLLVRAESFVSAFFLVCLVALVLLQVFSRYLFETPLSWTEELARYAMIWLVFIAAAQITSGDGHIVITLVDRFSSPLALKLFVILSRLTVFSACALLLPGGWRLVTTMMRVSAPASGIPPIQLGSVVILNLMIGLLTPPVGLVLYVLSSVTDIPFTRVAQGTAPFLIPLIVILALVTFVPALTTWLPGVFGLS